MTFSQFIGTLMLVGVVAYLIENENYEIAFKLAHLGYQAACASSR